MKILGIETSCDETAAAVVEDGKRIHSNIVASSLALHIKTGGIIPEVAAREQVKYITPVITQALKEGIGWDTKRIPDIDAIAVTYGPGLIGSLLVGVETAKTLSYLWNKPLIGVNHLFGHIYANFLAQEKEILFPALALVVSGGHTDLVLLKNHQDIKVIGKTRDDAAGECFDKCARLLGYPYPGGPHISQLATKGDPKNVKLPTPMLTVDFDFSFSGLKTAFMQQVRKDFPISNKENEQGYHWQHIEESLTPEQKQTIANLCAKLEDTIVETLVRKTTQAMSHYKVKSLLLGGGVSANQKLREEFMKISGNVFIPSPKLCTDNGAMIAAAAFFKQTITPFELLVADPQLYYE